MGSIILLSYLVVVNFIAFVMYGIDKRRAIKGRWRISEVRLLLIAVFGGSPGAWAGMHFFRHKTQHLKFQYGIPALLVMQITVATYLWMHPHLFY